MSLSRINMHTLLLQGTENNMSSIGCEAIRIPAEITHDVDHVVLLSDNLKLALFLNPEYSDVNLVVEGEKFPAHKIILAARSQVSFTCFTFYKKTSTAS